MNPAMSPAATSLVLGVGLSLVVGCGRTDLFGTNVDADWPGATSGTRDAVAIDLATAYRDGGARAESKPSVPSCAPKVPWSCVPGTKVGTSLALLDDLGTAFDILSFGDRVIVNGVLARTMDEGPQGRFEIVSVASRTVTRRDVQDGVPGLDMLAAGPAVVHRLGSSQRMADGTWQVTYDKIVRWDLETDLSIELPLPDGMSLYRPLLAANDTGEIFWTGFSNFRDGIAMWDPCTRASTLVLGDLMVEFLFADTSAVYWLGEGPSSSTDSISSLPIGGGPISQSRISGRGTPDRMWMDDSGVYYTREWEPGPGISVMPKTGGAGHTVIPNVTLGVGLVFDDASIYWSDDSDNSTLRRTAKSGGPSEILWSSPNRWLQAIAVDDCNVYWVVSNPFELFYRAR
jgi:hypothetical protein